MIPVAEAAVDVVGTDTSVVEFGTGDVEICTGAEVLLGDDCAAALRTTTRGLEI